MDNMKKLISVLLVVLMVASAYQCNNKTGSGKEGTLKGRLVIKEICSHYVVEVVSGNADTARVTNGWLDEKREKTYDNVFTVSNRCGFPAASINEGDEFEFTFEPEVMEDCAVCMAYYPTPPKKNAIKIVGK